MEIKLNSPVKYGLRKYRVLKVRLPSVAEIMQYENVREGSEFEQLSALIAACCGLPIKAVMAMSVDDFARVAEAACDLVAEMLGEVRDAPNYGQLHGQRSGIDLGA